MSGDDKPECLKRKHSHLKHLSSRLGDNLEEDGDRYEEIIERFADVEHEVSVYSSLIHQLGPDQGELCTQLLEDGKCLVLKVHSSPHTRTLLCHLFCVCVLEGGGGFLMILLNVVKMWFLPSASPPPPSTHSQPTINHPPTLQYHVMHCDAPRGCRSAIAPLSCASSPHSQQTDSSRGQRTASSSSARPPSKVQSGQCLNFFFGGGGKAGSLTHTHTRAHPNRLTDTHTLSLCVAAGTYRMYASLQDHCFDIAGAFTNPQVV